MKKLLFWMAGCLWTGIAPASRLAQGDTLVVVSPDSVIVSDRKDHIEIEVYGEHHNPNYRYRKVIEQNSNTATVVSQKKDRTDWDFQIPFSKNMPEKQSYKRRQVFIGGIGIGFVNALHAPADMNTKMSASREITLPNIIGIGWRPWRNNHRFSVGVGINWKNFRMTGKTRFIKEGQNLITGPYPDGADIKFSRLKVFSWTFPFLYQVDFGRKDHCSFQIGPVVNFNTYGSLKTRFVNAEGRKEKLIDKNIHHNPVTVDLMAELNFYGVGYYIKYSPCDMLDTDFGPEFQFLSMGISLFF